MTDSMTPEDTPRMTERTDRQAQIDPWDSVHEEFADMSQWETARVYRADAVDAARAADAALLRERDAQIASLTAQVEQQKRAFEDECGRHEQTLIGKRGFADLVAQLGAERDAAQQEAQTLREALEDVVGTIGGWHKGSIGSIGNVYVGSFGVERLNRLRAALSSSPRPQEPQPSCDCHLRERQVCDICQRPSAPDHSTSQEPGGHQP